MYNGFFDPPWWGYVVVTLVLTHITIVAVTIFLHRCQAHRALELHPCVSHFFRLWLWLTTGMQTKVWVAIHRKHHAKCETADDPHSPQTRGIAKVFWEGAELYREANTSMRVTRIQDRGQWVTELVKYSKGTPDDWIEHHLYTPFSWQGLGVMLVVDVVLFGPIGITMWAVQMLWIPVCAAGVINGVGHYFGYRNFDTPDASRNIVPWGFLIGGEELHNNHHAYPASARLSNKWWEFDIGWLYIRTLQFIRLAEVKKIPPKIVVDPAKTFPDELTLLAVLTAHYDVLARFDALARKLKGKETETVQELRTSLQALWARSLSGREKLLSQLRAWCEAAKKSDITAVQDFARRLATFRLKV